MEELSAIEHKISELKLELAQLESKKLKLLATKGTVSSACNNVMPPEQKVELFQRYFRGNTNCYAVRWQNKQGRSGYSIACHNEWQQAYAINPKLNVWSVLTNHSSFSTRMLSMITYQESLWLVFI